MENRILEINNKDIFICENHNEVIAFWSRFKQIKPFLISFDHHTDLHCAFQNKINGIGSEFKPKTQKEFLKIQKDLLLKLEENHFTNISELKNDEHIDAALKLGYFEKVLLYSFDSYFRKERVYTIREDEEYAGQNIIVNSLCIKENNFLIESAKLKPCFSFFNDCVQEDLWRPKYILDIDLDFFKTKDSINPHDGTFFKSLISGALAITIAKESKFVDMVKEEQSLTSDYLLEKLLDLIAK